MIFPSLKYCNLDFLCLRSPSVLREDSWDGISFRGRDGISGRPNCIRRFIEDGDKICFHHDCIDDTDSVEEDGLRIEGKDNMTAALHWLCAGNEIVFYEV